MELGCRILILNKQFVIMCDIFWEFCIIVDVKQFNCKFIRFWTGGGKNATEGFFF